MFVNFKSFGVAVLSAVLAATSVVAQSNPIINPGGGAVVNAGTTYTITWTPTSNGTVSLALGTGPASNVVTVASIASGIPNTGSYAWAVDPNTVAGTDYTIKITGSSSSDINFSARFTIDSSVTSSASASSTATSASSASSAATTSASSGATTSTKSGSSSASAASKTSSVTASTANVATSTPPPSSSMGQSLNIASVFMIATGIVAAVFVL